ncbi:MAG TPA: RDD family protein [Saprospiraceae bacterium]|nr:RDD family protein [Saprospiraceae bacterium]
MKLIELNTAQQVKLDFTLAPVQLRIFAFAIDYIILIALFYGIIFFGVFLERYYVGDFIETLMYFFVLIFFFYSLIQEIAFKGRSFGKIALNLKIIQLNGDPPTVIQLLARWMFRMIDIYGSFGTIAILLIKGSNASQRLGDLFGETIVIKVNENKEIKINDFIDRLNKISIIKYQNLKNVDDNIILLLKETILKYQKHPNPSTKTALEKIKKAISKRTNIKFSDEEHEYIIELNQLIEDYITQTR